jgi:hypothetical protein
MLHHCLLEIVKPGFGRCDFGAPVRHVLPELTDAAAKATINKEISDTTAELRYTHAEKHGTLSLSGGGLEGTSRTHLQHNPTLVAQRSSLSDPTGNG